MSQNRVLSLISLATKAGKTVSGEFCTEKEVKTGRAVLVIVADDASDNTKKKFKNMCDMRDSYIFLSVFSLFPSDLQPDLRMLHMQIA